jgi:hypothetical protein
MLNEQLYEQYKLDLFPFFPFFFFFFFFFCRGGHRAQQADLGALGSNNAKGALCDIPK